MYTFAMPGQGDGQPIDPANLHKLSVTLRADGSWHYIDATLGWGESRWASRRTTYIAQFRPMSVIFQPPTFDDTTDRAKVWVPLEKTGPRPDAHDPQAASMARLRMIISPSGTAQATYAKATRNYERAFLSVPFWRYVGNSVILVALTTGGAVFSASCEAGFRDAKWWWGLAQARIKQSRAWSRWFAVFAVALLVVVSLATRLLLRRDQHASTLRRRVASRRRGRCELSLVSAMISLPHQEPGLYDHLAPRIKLKLEGDLANVS
jgi:hypothetical protein